MEGRKGRNRQDLSSSLLEWHGHGLVSFASDPWMDGHGEEQDDSSLNYMANRIRNATIRQKSPMASDKAKPKMAYEKSCCFREGFLAGQQKETDNG